MIPCRECGQDSGWTQELIDQPLFGGNPNVAVCDDCCEEYQRRIKGEQVATPKHMQIPLEELIKPLYLETEIEQLPSQAQIHWQNAQHWSPSMKVGARFCGASRQGKTRVMMLLIKRLHEEGEVVRIFHAGEFHAELTQAKRSSWYTQWMKDVVTIPILAIDDLFAEKMTATTQAGLFEVVNQRMERGLPMLYTSQVTKSNAISLFDDKARGTAFVSRITETTTLYHFEENKQEELEVG